MVGEFLTQWSVRLAIMCYLARVVLDLRYRRDRRRAFVAETARWVWTIGCALEIVHVVAAFAVYHDWSHRAAYQHTAEVTATVLGTRWGGGLYFNYAFTLIWVADVAIWWRRGTEFPYRHPAYFWTIHALFAFIVFNATVVFGPPLWKWVAVVVTLIAWRCYLLGGR